ncbi:hypothetical protein KC926_00620 [Candidatus Kaiserbacteria bacterium]|nr:hypothetical protein [Candidatus Kaiserbacteria bacterium]
MLRRFSAIILLSLFVFTLFGGLFHISMGMDMGDGGSVSACPFMSHGEVVCSMDIFDHLAAWQSDFMMLVPASASLLGSLAAILLLSIAPHLLFSYQKLLSQRRIIYRQTNPSLVSLHPLQELFARGILNPKLF